MEKNHNRNLNRNFNRDNNEDTKRNHNKKAMLSVEASVALPLFLIAITLLLSLSSVFYINERIEAALCEEAKALALNNYSESIYGIGIIQARMTDTIGEGFLNSGMIKGGTSGLDFSESNISDKEIVEISVKYTIAFPFDMFGVLEMPFEQRIIMHAWTGYIHGLSGVDSYDYVYMTKNGAVYHRNKNCSHLKLTIKRVQSGDLVGLRNSSGAKYYPCEYCRPTTSDTRIYITTDGDRYHNTLTCAGLRRTIKRVKLSDIRGVPACSRCGY